MRETIKKFSTVILGTTVLASGIVLTNGGTPANAASERIDGPYTRIGCEARATLRQAGATFPGKYFRCVKHDDGKWWMHSGT